MVCLAKYFYPWLAEREDARARGWSCMLPFRRRGYTCRGSQTVRRPNTVDTFSFLPWSRLVKNNARRISLTKTGRSSNKGPFDQIHFIHTIMTVICLKIWVRWQAISGLSPITALGLRELLEKLRSRWGGVTAFRRRERFNHSEGVLVVLGLKWLRYMTVTWILPGWNGFFSQNV